LRAAGLTRPVAWSLSTVAILDHQAFRTGTTFGGRSHTLAVRVALLALRDGLDLDPSCLLAAELDGDVPKNVDLKAKCDAAWKSGRINRVVIAKKAHFKEDGTDYQDGVRRMDVLRCDTLARALDEATGLGSGLRLYLEMVQGLVNEHPAPYLGKRQLSDLYIEPDVLRNDTRSDREADPGKGELAGRVEMGAGTEEQELRQHYRHRTQPARTAWRREWPRLRRKRAVLVGYPGEGKTVLARMTARALAEQGLVELAGGEVSTATVTLPVYLPLATLAEHGRLEDAVRATLAARNLPTRLVDHLCAGLLQERCWLILDGLDEVSGERWDGLRRELERLAGARC
jgi:NACHT domain